MPLRIFKWSLLSFQTKNVKQNQAIQNIEIRPFHSRFPWTSKRTLAGLRKANKKKKEAMPTKVRKMVQIKPFWPICTFREIILNSFFQRPLIQQKHWKLRWMFDLAFDNGSTCHRHGQLKNIRTGKWITMENMLNHWITFYRMRIGWISLIW